MKTNFLKRFVQGGSLSLVKLVIGLAKIKVLAVLLGVDGIGLLSLGLQFQATAVGLVSMSLAVGVINLGRPLWVAGNVQGASEVLGTALGMVVINSLVFFVTYLFFQPFFFGILMHAFETHGVGLFWPLVMAAVIVSFANVLWEGMSFLVDRFDIYVRANIVATICDAFVFIGGTWLFGLKGALYASLLGGLLQFIAYTVFSARVPAVFSILNQLSVTKRLVRPLFSYSLLMLTTTAVGLASIFLARAHLTEVSGEAANGYLQVVTAFAAYMMPFVMTAVHGHMYPAAAASGDTPDARVELRSTLVVSMRLAAAGCVAVVIGAPVLVRMVYTSAFLVSQQYIPVYFIGELSFVFLSVMGAYLLAVGQKRPYFLGYTLYHGVLLAGVFAGAGLIGPWAYVLSHLVAASFVGVLAIGYGLRYGMLDSAILKLLAVCVIPAAVCCVLDYHGWGIELNSFTVRASWVLGPIVIMFVMLPFSQTALQKIQQWRLA